MYDKYNDVYRFVPLSGSVAGLCANTDTVADAWFSPAGFNRGNVRGAIKLAFNPDQADRDVLYQSRVNPVVNFPGQGVVLFGDKTALSKPSAFDRINVRRLVIFLKKNISILSSQVLFEQNVQATWNRFKSLIEPFLANVKTQFGITDYRLILDETTTTPDLIDQNVLYAKIMVKPARAIEFIAIDFVIASTGASFDD